MAEVPECGAELERVLRGAHGCGLAVAYQAGDGTLVALKDQFVLAVDPSAAPPAIRKADLAFAATLAVMGCWAGGT